MSDPTLRLHLSAQAEEFLMQCLLNEMEACFPAGPRGPVLQQSLRVSNTLASLAISCATVDPFLQHPAS